MGYQNFRGAGYADHRYGAPSKAEPHRRILKGEKREHVVHRVMDVLRSWRFSRFEHEGAARAGLRSALCLAGHGWGRADAEAAAIVDEGLRLMGAVRPSWAEGQWNYTTPRENCAWCGGDIAQEDWSTWRYCSAMCAKSALESRVIGDFETDAGARIAAYRAIQKDKAPAICCKACGKEFRSANKKAEYCSPKCVASVRKISDKECVVCGTIFHPQRESVACCSRKCAGIHRAALYRANMPEVTCECCKAVFRATRPYAKYCSKRCQGIVSGRLFRMRRKQSKVRDVPLLTALAFDECFLMAA